MRRRLVLERKLLESSTLRAALDASLNAIGARAWIVDARGRVVLANAAHRARPIAMTLDQLKRVAERGEVELSTIRGRGLPAYTLVVERPAIPDADALLATAAAAWELTPRQSQVLRYVVEGWSNKAIAAQLGCAPHTIELHVAALFDRAAVDSRAELVAVFWRRMFTRSR